MVTRMNALKEKETPGSTTAKKDDGKSAKKGKKLSAEAEAQLEEKERLFEEYTEKLRTEFKYSKKEIQADPEYQEMKAEIDKLKKGKKRKKKRLDYDDENSPEEESEDEVEAAANKGKSSKGKPPKNSSFSRNRPKRAKK